MDLPVKARSALAGLVLCFGGSTTYYEIRLGEIERRYEQRYVEWRKSRDSKMEEWRARSQLEREKLRDIAASTAVLTDVACELCLGNSKTRGDAPCLRVCTEQR